MTISSIAVRNCGVLLKPGARTGAELARSQAEQQPRASDVGVDERGHPRIAAPPPCSAHRPGAGSSMPNTLKRAPCPWAFNLAA